MKTHPDCILIDNHDSFVFNLYRYLDEFMPDRVKIIQNDKIDLDELKNAKMIVISPGPDLPSNAGRTKEVIHTFYQTKPILGICLGHQAIFEVFGGKLKLLEKVCHGMISEIIVNEPNDVLFQGIFNPINAGRYHSWVADEQTLPKDLRITSYDRDLKIMSITHKDSPVFGVQFHPESIMTPMGRQLIGNFVKFAKTWNNTDYVEI